MHPPEKHQLFRPPDNLHKGYTQIKEPSFNDLKKIAIFAPHIKKLKNL